MNTEELNDLFEELGVTLQVEASRRSYFVDSMRDLLDEPDISDHRAIDPRSLATAIERLALDTATSEDERLHLFDEAFLCRRSVNASNLDPKTRVLHYFYLSIDALLANKHPEIMLLLRENASNYTFDFSQAEDWLDELLARIARSFILLCRRGNGWGDVRNAVAEIDALRTRQDSEQETTRQMVRRDHRIAGWLVAEFNLAKIVDIAAKYIIAGSPPDALIQIDRHASNATEILEAYPNSELLHFVDLLAAGSNHLIRSSIWHDTRRLGTRIRDFVDQLTSAGNTRPVLQLWPSQQAALNSSLLNPAKRAIVIEMPTSAGKTLLAEFSIVQALALNPGSRVAYVVPTRALINQIVIRLRSDVGALGYVVEAAVPVFEIDPTEDSLLRRDIDVLVVTPEKLDLLIRTGHPAVASLSLVVADEAHNIGDGARGVRLELLLGTLRRERAETRFLLLTPFIPNGDTLSEWLGDDREGTIQVSWRPSERITLASHWKKPKNKPYELVFSTLPSASNVDLQDELELNLGPTGLEGDRAKGRVAVSTALRLSKRGGVLLLARGRKVSEQRASEIADHLENHDISPFAESVVRYVESELGIDHELPRLLQKGVAYHHAGLSHDIRYLIELLIDKEDVRVVCGTSTLAQGVNFPIASVIVETLKKSMGIGNGWTDLTFPEFWNIAGRAGRALKDRLGLVVFPTSTKKELNEAKAFLRREAGELASALLEALANFSGATSNLGLGFVRQNRELAVFLQYLTHAMRISGFEAAPAELEDILRSSLVYHQTRQENRRAAENLVRLARRYVEELQGRNPGYLSLADGTGFSLYSVDLLLGAQRNRHPEFGDVDFWTRSNLFSEDLTPLSSVVSLLAEVPELTLGHEQAGPFNAERVAGIVRDWVAGATVTDISDRWFSHIADKAERRRQAGHYLYSRLIGQIPWGLGAIQRLALQNAEDIGEAAHIASMIFYGVPSAGAATMRMVGVPRCAAPGMAAEWDATSGSPARSHQEIRDWIARRTEEDWNSSLGSANSVSGADCRSIWSALNGVSLVDAR